MRYNMKKIFATTAMALILNLTCYTDIMAQDISATDQKGKIADFDSSIPDEIFLFGEENNEIKNDAKIEKDKKTPNSESVKKDVKETKTVKAIPGGKVVTETKKVTVKTVKSGSATVNKPLAGVPDININKKGALLTPPQAASKGANTQAKKDIIAQNVKTVKNIKATEDLTQKVTTSNTEKVNNKVDDKKGKPIKVTTRMVSDLEDSVFEKMSNIEKETAILNLELRKEKVKNDIEALKAIRSKAEAEEQKRLLEEKLKLEEKAKEAERQKIIELQKLKDKEIAYEKLRQEKILKDYKNKMLLENQKWIDKNLLLYKEIKSLKQQREEFIGTFKSRLENTSKTSEKLAMEAIKAKDRHEKRISDYETRISILKAKLENAINTAKNPFGTSDAEGINDESTAIVRLSDLYAIMEIRGQGENMRAKLINEKGNPFWVKVGTSLQSGHVVDEIAETYVRGDKAGAKDYLYFAAGGILDREPLGSDTLNVTVSSQSNSPKLIGSKGIPGLGGNMMVR